jgi:hypothetical protein
MRIAFSKASGAPKYERYIEWLRSVDPTLEPVDLSRTSEPLQALAQCAGLVLTGGPDIAPERYGHPEYEQFCTEPPDPERDELEFALVHEALERYRLPVLGSAGCTAPQPLPGRDPVGGPGAAVPRASASAALEIGGAGFGPPSVAGARHAAVQVHEGG